MRNVILAGIGACFLLIACGGGGTRSAAPPPSASAAPSSATSSSSSVSATPTPSSTATTPLLTGAAVKPGEVPPTLDPHFITHDSGGAIAFAGYFYRALDWSIATSNANLLRPISSPDCTACQHYIHDIDRTEAAGGYSEGGRIQLSMFEPVHGTAVAAEFTIKVTMSQDTQVLVNPDGGRSTYAPVKNPGVNYLYEDWKDGQWIAVEIQLG